jgi:hypothetical protein
LSEVPESVEDKVFDPVGEAVVRIDAELTADADAELESSADEEIVREGVGVLVLVEHKVEVVHSEYVGEEEGVALALLEEDDEAVSEADSDAD